MANSDSTAGTTPLTMEEFLRKLEADPNAHPMKPEDQLPSGSTQVTFIPPKPK